MKRCVILSGGDILCYKNAAAHILPGDFIVCADSGYRHCKPLGATPNLLVGDFDSIGDMPCDVDILRYRAEKDFTDTNLAADWALEHGFEAIVFMGATGGKRIEHSLANLQTAAGCAEFCEASFYDGHSYMQLVSASSPKSLYIEPRKGHYFSLLALSEECPGVTITGGKYPLDDYTLRYNEARAISNEFCGAPVQIKLNSGTLLIIITPMD